LLVLAVLTGCGGGSSRLWVDTSALAGTGPWVKTARVVNGVAEVPVTVPMSYAFLANGTYIATDGALIDPYTESGTWSVGELLVINMTTNNAGQPAATLSAAINGTESGQLANSNQFTITYDSSIGGGQSLHIVETYTRTP